MRLTNATKTVLDALLDLINEGNHDPSKHEIAEGIVGGSLGEGTHIEQMVHRALPAVVDYLREVHLKPVVPVSGGYYQEADEDLGIFGLGRKLPKNVAEAKIALALFGRPTMGVVYVTKGSAKNGGGYLLEAYELMLRKVHLMGELNYRAKVQRYEDRKWLPAGFGQLTIADVAQQLQLTR